MVAFLACVLLLLVGLYAILLKRNLIRIAIGFSLMEYAINLFFALIGYKRDALAPIITELGMARNFVDPLPQALVLTSIVIGLATSAGVFHYGNSRPFGR